MAQAVVCEIKLWIRLLLQLRNLVQTFLNQHIRSGLVNRLRPAAIDLELFNVELVHRACAVEPSSATALAAIALVLVLIGRPDVLVELTLRLGSLVLVDGGLVKLWLHQHRLLLLLLLLLLYFGW